MHSFFSSIRTPSLIWVSTALYIAVGFFDAGLLSNYSLTARWGYTLTKVVLLFVALFIGLDAAEGRRKASIILACMLTTLGLLLYVAYHETH